MTGDLATPHTIGIDLGGTRVRIARVDPDGNICHDVETATPNGWEAVLATVTNSVREIATQATTDDASVGALGFGIAAIVDNDGVARYAPNLQGFINVPIRDQLSTSTGLPTVVDNDANVAAWGELAHGAARGVRHGLILTLGTGIGGGIILDGRVYRGAHGFAAEVGHWQFDPHGPTCACGQPGHWEAWASGTGLGTLARAAASRGEIPSVLDRASGDPSAVTGIHVGDAALAGEPDALRLLDQFADYVAIGFAGLANILDPEVIVVSGGLVSLGDVLMSRIRDRFPLHLEAPAYRPRIPVVAATLGEQAGVIGAAVLARELLA